MSRKPEYVTWAGPAVFSRTAMALLPEDEYIAADWAKMLKDGESVQVEIQVVRIVEKQG